MHAAHAVQHLSSIYSVNLGEVAEWPNAAVSKTVTQGNLGREFESLPLRQLTLC